METHPQLGLVGKSVISQHTDRQNSSQKHSLLEMPECSEIVFHDFDTLVMPLKSQRAARLFFMTYILSK